MNTDKRKEIENVVNSHPTLNKVADYLNQNFNIPKEQAYNKFIDFLEKEVEYVYDKNFYGVKCFEFDEVSKEFKNRTKCNVTHFTHRW